MKHILFCFLSTLSLLSFSASAEMRDKHGSSIEQVYINSDGVMLVQVSGVVGYLSIGKVGDKTAEIMYSTALAAKLSNQSNLWIRYWDAVDGYPSIGIIAIK
jgi:hypothetical protein